MTASSGAPDVAEPGAGIPSDARPTEQPLPQPLRSAVDAVAGTCPYLESVGGAWRLIAPSRDHRCIAVEPPAPQTTEKQRRHCLAPDHVDCPLYRSARSARATSLAAGADVALVASADRLRRPIARTAPILLEPPRLVDHVTRLQLERAPGQLALIGLMVVAFLIVAVTRLADGGTPAASPNVAVIASSPSAAPTRSPTPRASAPLIVGPSASPSGSASAGATYKVKKGDTLVSIARKFNTTAAKIRSLNGLTSSTIRVGQVLKIP